MNQFDFPAPNVPTMIREEQGGGKEDQDRAELSQIEVEVIEIFVSLTRVLGMPKSVAEIYGLLFVSPLPLPLDIVMSKLNISKGSTSQGLKLLRSLGAVKAVYMAGDRRDHYLAEIELKKLVQGFIRGEVHPRLESGETRLSRLKHLVPKTASGTEDAFYAARVGKLAQWHDRGQSLVPLLNTLLE